MVIPVLLATVLALDLAHSPRATLADTGLPAQPPCRFSGGKSQRAADTTPLIVARIAVPGATTFCEVHEARLNAPVSVTLGINGTIGGARFEIRGFSRTTAFATVFQEPGSIPAPPPRSIEEWHDGNRRVSRVNEGIRCTIEAGMTSHGPTRDMKRCEANIGSLSASYTFGVLRIGMRHDPGHGVTLTLRDSSGATIVERRLSLGTIGPSFELMARMYEAIDAPEKP